MTQNNFTCAFCKYEFASEKRYNNHYCEEMKKVDYFKTSHGKSAFYFYKEWLRLKRYNFDISEDTFLHAKYFSCFVKFIIYSNSMMLPDKFSFIKHMVESNILPTFWCTNDIYVNYIEKLDEIYSPEKQAEATITTLHEIASIYECKINEVFDHLEVGDCINLIKTRKLSPWLILCCKSFFNYLSINLTKEQRLFVQTALKPSLWTHKFKKSPEIVQKMKELANSYNL